MESFRKMNGMLGWTGYLLNVNLSSRKANVQRYDLDFAMNFLGGRGFAAKILWDRLPKGTDSFSPKNILIFAAGPLSGYPLPNSGKLVVASKSPLTNGYGDGNLGTWAAVHLRRAGYDAIIIEGKATKPIIIYVKDKDVDFLDATDYWGTDTFQNEVLLRKIYGKTVGIVSIGQGGENLVKFACICSQEGRAGGRPGMGAVMGSKNLKALVIEGSGQIPLAYPDELKKQGIAGYREILTKPNFKFWKRQGTLSTVEWGNEHSVLPTYNYREGVFAGAEQIGGFAAEAIKVSNRGCPNCNMTCGNVVKDAEEKESELDYENIAMLGSNIGLGNLEQVSVLNRMADEFGLDTISLGNTIGFAMEASEKGLIKEKVSWGNFEEARELCKNITFRRGIGEVLAEGVRNAAAKICGGSSDWAMHINGLEISAYNCHTVPAMALAYTTSPIGAHHKDAWVIAWELSHDRFGYGEEKADYVIETQHGRGIFECLGVCRFPVVNLGLGRDWYPKYLQLATSETFTWDSLMVIAERVFNLVRAFWVREAKGGWSSSREFPPARWFDEPLTAGKLKGSKLDRANFERLLQCYYRKRGWTQEGIPTKEKLCALGLGNVAESLYSTLG